MSQYWWKFNKAKASEKLSLMLTKNGTSAISAASLSLIIGMTFAFESDNKKSKIDKIKSFISQTLKRLNKSIFENGMKN